MTKANLDAYIFCMKKNFDSSDKLEWLFDRSSIDRRIDALEDLIKKELSILNNISHH